MVKPQKIAIFGLNLLTKKVPAWATRKTKNNFLCKNNKRGSNINDGIRAVLDSLLFFFLFTKTFHRLRKSQNHKRTKTQPSKTTKR